MKTIKQISILMLLLLPFVLFAQTETGSDPVESIPYFKFIAAFALSTLAGLLTNAFKYIGSSSWNGSVFLKTIILPWALSLGGGIVLVAIEYFAPFAKDYLFLIGVDGEISLDYTSLFTLGFSLSIAVKKLVDKFKK